MEAASVQDRLIFSIFMPRRLWEDGDGLLSERMTLTDLDALLHQWNKQQVSQL